MMDFGFTWVMLQIIIFVVLLLLSLFIFDKRYKSKPPSSSNVSMMTGELERTSEVHIDPNDGQKYRVYYNRKTGERVYIKEE